jgi:hypothetical protein
MNIDDFKSKTPYLIEHPNHGIGEREIIINKPNEKGVCYRYKNNSASFGTYGKTWQDVFDSLFPFLEKEGFIK